jgi:RNA polymerase sigma-70 factor (ECF subfamily)
MARSDEREARFERLYREHAAPVFAYALRRSSPDEAADAAAETFVVAWRRLGEVSDDHVLPWLYEIARRVLSTQRRSGRRQHAIATRVAFEQGEQTTPGPDRIAPAVLRALAELHADEREVLMLTAWEELSSPEAAAVLGCSPTAYRIRLHRARLRLRRVMSELDTTPLVAPHSVRTTIKENSSC